MLLEYPPIEEVEQDGMFHARKKFCFPPGLYCAGAEMWAEKRSVKNG
jgi:hypothetical protein